VSRIISIALYIPNLIFDDSYIFFHQKNNFGLRMSRRLLASTLLLLLTLHSSSKAAVVTDACWEKCFQVRVLKSGHQGRIKKFFWWTSFGYLYSLSFQSLNESGFRSILAWVWHHSIWNWMRFEPTTFQSWVKFANH